MDTRFCLLRPALPGGWGGSKCPNTRLGRAGVSCGGPHRDCGYCKVRAYRHGRPEYLVIASLCMLTCDAMSSFHCGLLLYRMYRMYRMYHMYRMYRCTAPLALWHTRIHRTSLLLGHRHRLGIQRLHHDRLLLPLCRQLRFRCGAAPRPAVPPARGGGGRGGGEVPTHAHVFCCGRISSAQCPSAMYFPSLGCQHMS